MGKKYLIEESTVTSWADAIREKTDTSDKMTIEQMTSAVAGIQSGYKLVIDSEEMTDPLELRSEYLSKGFEVPWSNDTSQLVTLNNELHVLGGGSSSTYRKYHYKLNYTTGSFTKMSTLPFELYYGCAVVYNGEIHILGGSIASTSHYKWNGSKWTSVSTLPFGFEFGCAVVYNGEIHILGYNSLSWIDEHYKWDGSTWTLVSTLPYAEFSFGCAVVYNDSIHILGGIGGTTYHYKWNGSKWTKLTNIPFAFTAGCAAVNSQGIHIMDGEQENLFHGLWNGSAWISPPGDPKMDPGELPYGSVYGSATTLNDTIYYLSGTSTTYNDDSFAEFTDVLIELNAEVYRIDKDRLSLS